MTRAAPGPDLLVAALCALSGCPGAEHASPAPAGSARASTGPLDAAAEAIAPLGDAAGDVGDASPTGTEACVPRDDGPSGYGADAVDSAHGFDLHAGVRVHVGEVPGAEREGFDDAAWAAVDLPASVPARGAATIWLRRRFTIAKGTPLEGLALDAGGYAGEATVWLDGRKLGAPKESSGPFFATDVALHEGQNVLAIRVRAPRHVGGLRSYGALAIGRPRVRRRGLVYARFRSAVDGSEQPLAVYVPTCVDRTTPRPLVVALPGWNGDVHVFSHSRLLREAERRGWFVVVPDPRGNVLYTGAAERGVLEAIAHVRASFAIDEARIFLTGVSMGGAGALQIGYHFPDRFAAIAAYYGDSLYELASYVGPILKTQAEADRYSVLRFADNARDLPVLLVHAKDDRVSPFSQSKLLADEDARLGLAGHRLLALETGGHSLAVVEQTIDEVVALFATSARVAVPARVTFATGSASYPGAYWLGVAPRREGTIGGVDATLDAAKGRVTLTRIDPAVSRVAIDLARASLKLPLALDLAIGGDVAIAGLAPLAPVVLAGAGEHQALAADERGLVVLGDLAPGEWSIEPSARPNAAQASSAALP